MDVAEVILKKLDKILEQHELLKSTNRKLHAENVQLKLAIRSHRMKLRAVGMIPEVGSTVRRRKQRAAASEQRPAMERTCTME
jgi:hypothetical protein